MKSYDFFGIGAAIVIAMITSFAITDGANSHEISAEQMLTVSTACGDLPVVSTKAYRYKYSVLCEDGRTVVFDK
jgi:hypothetical protein